MNHVPPGMWFFFGLSRNVKLTAPLWAGKGIWQFYFPALKYTSSVFLLLSHQSRNLMKHGSGQKSRTADSGLFLYSLASIYCWLLQEQRTKEENHKRVAPPSFCFSNFQKAPGQHNHCVTGGFHVITSHYYLAVIVMIFVAVAPFESVATTFRS